jgi:hypothetical protein
MIDIDEAKKLVHALEADLAKVQSGSAQFQTLKDEVAALKSVLESPDPGHGWVRDALHSIHTAIDQGADVARVDAIIAARYVAAIGKMLGL